MKVLYIDNHLAVVEKLPGEIVQGDKSGDPTLIDAVKDWIKQEYNKPGNVFCGLVHRLDRPVGGLVVFARTSKALARLNDMFRDRRVNKRYWAIVRNRPPKDQDTLTNYIYSVERNNKSYICATRKPGSKEASLTYRLIGKSDSYYLLEIDLHTGRKHQIRAQLASIGCPVKGDLKYGDKRSNPDGSISLRAQHVDFVHPVSGKEISVDATIPDAPLWQALAASIKQESCF